MCSMHGGEMGDGQLCKSCTCGVKLLCSSQVKEGGCRSSSLKRQSSQGTEVLLEPWLSHAELYRR